MQSCGTPSANVMKWMVNLVAEAIPGHPVEHEVATLEREDRLAPATVGLTIAEGKVILEGLQKQMVTLQVQHYNASLKSCFRCGKSFRTKGYYQSTLRSVYGHVPTSDLGTHRLTVQPRTRIRVQ